VTFDQVSESGVDNIAAWGIIRGVTCNDLAGLFEETFPFVVQFETGSVSHW